MVADYIVNPRGADTGIFRENDVDTTGGDALDPCVDMSQFAMPMTI